MLSSFAHLSNYTLSLLHFFPLVHRFNSGEKALKNGHRAPNVRFQSGQLLTTELLTKKKKKILVSVQPGQRVQISGSMKSPSLGVRCVLKGEKPTFPRGRATPKDSQKEGQTACLSRQTKQAKPEGNSDFFAACSSNSAHMSWWHILGTPALNSPALP